jgi:hypothetical protein
MTRVLALLGLALVTGCAILPRGHAGPGVQLFVANESWDPVEVIVTRDGVAQPLGRVWKHQYPVFDLETIPGGQVSRIVVAVVAEHGESFQTDTILARAGTSIDMRLQTPLRYSRWWQSHRVARASQHAGVPAH